MRESVFSPIRRKPLTRKKVMGRSSQKVSKNRGKNETFLPTILIKEKSRPFCICLNKDGLFCPYLDKKSETTLACNNQWHS